MRFQPDPVVADEMRRSCILARTGQPFARVEWERSRRCLVIREQRPDEKTWVIATELRENGVPRQVTHADIAEVLSRRQGRNHVIRQFKEFIERKQREKIASLHEYEDRFHEGFVQATVGVGPTVRKEWEAERRRVREADLAKLENQVVV